MALITDVAAVLAVLAAACCPFDWMSLANPMTMIGFSLLLLIATSLPRRRCHPRRLPINHHLVSYYYEPTGHPLR